MQKAIAAVEQGEASICHAAKKYGIPRSTFFIYTGYLPLAVGMLD